MRIFSITRYLSPLAVLLAVTLLSACAATGRKTESIEDRANARWAALFNGNIGKAYGYFTPGFRSSVSLEQYQRALAVAPVKWTSAKYISSQCDEARCDVKMLVTITVKNAVPGVKSFDAKDYIDETWILVDGKWFMVPED